MCVWGGGGYTVVVFHVRVTGGVPRARRVSGYADFLRNTPVLGFFFIIFRVFVRYVSRPVRSGWRGLKSKKGRSGCSVMEGKGGSGTGRDGRSRREMAREKAASTLWAEGGPQLSSRRVLPRCAGVFAC